MCSRSTTAMTKSSIELKSKLKPAIDFFPLPAARPPQVEALEFFSQMYDQGFRDFVVAAPTGVGKTGIGAATCCWGSQPFPDKQNLHSGGFYLVTQKLLQDQIEKDFTKFKWPAGSIKSSIEYPCSGAQANCMLGQRRKPRCEAVREGRCRQKLAKALFDDSLLGVTNYPYYLTSHIYDKIKPRRVVVCDECHTLERQLMSFVELTINKEVLLKFAPDMRMPNFKGKADFVHWLTSVYAPVLLKKLESLGEAVNEGTITEEALLVAGMGESGLTAIARRFNELQAHLTKVSMVAEQLDDDESNWLFWQEENDGHLDSIAKPLYVDNFAREFFESADVRLYLSAYPGPKRVFCRCLGLNHKEVAWLDIPSAFPKENRLVHLLLVGSMSRSNQESTMPALLRMCEHIMDKHGTEKGLIHCHKYELGETIYRYLYSKGYANRVLFPRKARERIEVLRQHHQSSVPTVMISPSMTEGFSLDDDLARFQIVTKMPFPYLGDRQIKARQEADEDWYAMHTAYGIIQACGRIVRSEEDFGSTYILDSDINRLLDKHPDFFPDWFTEAFVDYSASPRITTQSIK